MLNYKKDYFLGLLVLLAILSFYAISFKALLSFIGDIHFSTYLNDPFLWYVLKTSGFQALLSSLLSIFLGIITARVFYYHSFWGKNFLLKIFSSTFVFPSLIVVLALMGIYGFNGWISWFFSLFSITYQGDFQGLYAIIIAHLFFNIPFATRVFHTQLQSIPPEHHQLSQLLQIKGINFFRLIELPILKNELIATFSLIFLLCFTSFSIVLTLGGAQYSTLEVVIYQAVLFEFNFEKAVFFALLQSAIGFTLLSISSLINKHKSQMVLKEYKAFSNNIISKFVAYFWIIIIACFVLSVPLNVIVSAFYSDKWLEVLQDNEFQKAFYYSVFIAFSVSLLTIIFAFFIIKMSRRLVFLGYIKLSNLITNITFVILSVPTLVLSLGLFIYLIEYDISSIELLAVLIFANSLMALPFVIRVLKPPMTDIFEQQEKLCQLLRIQGFSRFRLIEWHRLKTPITYSLCLAGALSIGDFTVIALFGNFDFTTLPYYLYQSISRYQMDKGVIIAFILLVFYMLLFLGIKEND